MSIKPVVALTDLLPPAPNAHPSQEAKIEHHVDQDVVNGWLHAEADASEAAVLVFRAATQFKVSPAQMEGRADAKVRASEFNQAFELAKRIGRAPAIKIIETASRLNGCKRSNVLAAIRSHKKIGDQLKGSALKGAALAKAISAGAEAASKEVQAKREAKQAAEKEARATRPPALPKEGTLDAFIPQLLAMLIDARTQLGKMDIPSRAQKLVGELNTALEEATKLAGEVNDR